MVRVLLLALGTICRRPLSIGSRLHCWLRGNSSRLQRRPVVATARTLAAGYAHPDTRASSSPETLVTVPDFEWLMRPCLAVREDGERHASADWRDRLAERMQMAAEARAILLPSGSQPLFTNRVAWAVTHLAQAGLLDRPSRG